MVKLPIAINNWYCCTIPQKSKRGQKKINDRLETALSKIQKAMIEIIE